MPKKISTPGTEKLLRSSNYRHSVASDYSVPEETVVYEDPLTEDEKTERYEKYQLSGDFEKDFLYLASLIDLKISIVHRKNISYGRCDSLRDDVSRLKEEKGSIGSLETLRDNEWRKKDSEKDDSRCDYCKHFLEIGTEWESHREHVKEIFVRGWVLSLEVISLISKTAPDLERISLINMWNVGLTEDSLHALCKSFQSLSSLKTLILDGNGGIRNQRFDHFLKETDKLRLEHFSVRNCSLDELGAAYIAEALTSNTSLLTLNLCFNRIGDIGVKNLARSLRLNRSLLSLNVASNDISNEGVRYICDALTTFCLTHEQVIARRKKLILNAAIEAANQIAETVTKEEQVPSRRGESRSRGGTKGMKNGSDSPKIQKSAKQKSTPKSEKRKSIEPTNTDDVISFNDPLLEKVTEINGQLWIPGNRSLISLNMSRNRITNVGVQMLVSTVKYQIQNSPPMKSFVGNGLLRLCVKCKDFPAEDPSYVALRNMMHLRDPLHHKPVPVVEVKEQKWLNKRTSKQDLYT